MSEQTDYHDWTIPTVGADEGIHGTILNAAIRDLDDEVALADTIANRPNPGTADRLFLATDERALYRDDGSMWVLLDAPDATNRAWNALNVYDPGPSTNLASWEKSSSNPVLTPGSGTAWDSADIRDISVVRRGGTYQAAYGAGDGTNPNRIGVATSTDLVTWTKNANNPVIGVGGGGAWDEDAIADPALLYDGEYKLYYRGDDDSASTKQIGLATASSFGASWTKDSNNPLLTEGGGGAFDEAHVREPTVFHAAGMYHMYYVGQDSGGAEDIGYASSDDGISWTKSGSNPVLQEAGDSSWEDTRLAWPHIHIGNATVYLFYSGLDGNGTTVRTGLATAPLSDPANLTKDTKSPVLGAGSTGDWDEDGAQGMEILRRPGDHGYAMMFAGRSGSPGSADIQIGLAELDLTPPV